MWFLNYDGESINQAFILFKKRQNSKISVFIRCSSLSSLFRLEPQFTKTIKTHSHVNGLYNIDFYGKTYTADFWIIIIAMCLYTCKMDLAPRHMPYVNAMRGICYLKNFMRWISLSGNYDFTRIWTICKHQNEALCVNFIYDLNEWTLEYEP